MHTHTHKNTHTQTYTKNADIVTDCGKNGYKTVFNILIYNYNLLIYKLTNKFANNFLEL